MDTNPDNPLLLCGSHKLLITQMKETIPDAELIGLSINKGNKLLENQQCFIGSHKFMKTPFTFEGSKDLNNLHGETI